MKIDPNWAIFVKNSNWYTFQKGVGYVPTDTAPKEVVEAIKRYNSYTFKKISEL